jgi:hypothetical protein
MAQQNQNFIHYKGNDKVLNFTVSDVATVEGCTARWTMSATQGSTPLITKYSPPHDPAKISLSGKVISVTIDSDDTDDASPISAGTYYHECELVDTDGNISTVAEGAVDLRDVTLRIT